MNALEDARPAPDPPADPERGLGPADAAEVARLSEEVRLVSLRRAAGRVRPAGVAEGFFRRPVARWDDLAPAEASRRILALVKLGRGHELLSADAGEVDDGDD